MRPGPSDTTPFSRGQHNTPKAPLHLLGSLAAVIEAAPVTWPCSSQSLPLPLPFFFSRPMGRRGAAGRQLQSVDGKWDLQAKPLYFRSGISSVPMLRCEGVSRVVVGRTSSSTRKLVAWVPRRHVQSWQAVGVRPAAMRVRLHGACLQRVTPVAQTSSPTERTKEKSGSVPSVKVVLQHGTAQRCAPRYGLLPWPASAEPLSSLARASPPGLTHCTASFLSLSPAGEAA